MLPVVLFPLLPTVSAGLAGVLTGYLYKRSKHPAKQEMNPTRQWSRCDEFSVLLATAVFLH